MRRILQTQSSYRSPNQTTNKLMDAATKTPRLEQPHDGGVPMQRIVSPISADRLAKVTPEADDVKVWETVLAAIIAVFIGAVVLTACLLLMPIRWLLDADVRREERNRANHDSTTSG